MLRLLIRPAVTLFLLVVSFLLGFMAVEFSILGRPWAFLATLIPFCGFAVAAGWAAAKRAT